jgi:hypothetical protein
MSWWTRLFGKEAKEQEEAFRSQVENTLKKAEELDAASKLIRARNNIKLKAAELAAEHTDGHRKRQSSTA